MTTWKLGLRVGFPVLSLTPSMRSVVLTVSKIILLSLFIKLSVYCLISTLSLKRRITLQRTFFSWSFNNFFQTNYSPTNTFLIKEVTGRWIWISMRDGELRALNLEIPPQKISWAGVSRSQTFTSFRKILHPKALIYYRGHLVNFAIIRSAYWHILVSRSYSFP